ncbi:MAG: hypothetical protein KME20_08340 [Kaiparowitsia implicata GSE-PSE-MK54-09C]|jgi:hypothetical protein|nr:hypothetical protein [Kaiparowitsia implicata GSE-PSE-MK54-09C]
MKTSIIRVLMASGCLLLPMVLPQEAVAQRVVDIAPASDSATARPDASISGQFDTVGTPEVDPASVRIFVNNVDVTANSTITSRFFSYRPTQPFAPGAVRVRVEYRNVSGQSRSSTWMFTVQPQVAIQLNSVTHNAVTPLTTGATFSVTLNGTPGGQAAILLVEDGQAVRELTARETSSGVYTASVRVGAGDRLNEAVVIGRLRGQGQTVYGAASQAAAFNVASAPQPVSPTPVPEPEPVFELRPRFTSHQEGDRVGTQGFTLVGRSRPNATVQVRVVLRASVLGIGLDGQTLIDETVTANADGRFEAQVPSSALAGLPAQLQYRVQATATDGEETSPRTELTLRP